MMIRRVAALLVFAGAICAEAGAGGRVVIDNPAIDMPGFLTVAGKAAAHREQRRVSEEEFIRISREPGTIVLDARSGPRFAELHVKGAINLSFPDITIETLKTIIPDKSTRILIYCNNNFSNALTAFPSKLPSASLNLSTYIALHNYGYENVYELGPLLDARATKIAFESSWIGGKAPSPDSRP